MKIAFFQTHYKIDSRTILHPVDLYRIAGPALELKKNTDLSIDLFSNLPKRFTGMGGLKSLTSNYSIGYMSYTDRVRSLLLLRNYSKKSKMKLIMDLDDNIWELPKSHIGYRSTHIGTPNFHSQLSIAKEMDCITCTTSQLRKRLQKWLPNQRIEVVPNFFNSNIYNSTTNTNANNKLKTIVFFGSESHNADCELKPFLRALFMIFDEFKNVNFLSIGFKNDTLAKNLKRRYRSIEGTFDIKYWVKLWERHVIKSDISVCPLIPNSFNMSKSPIKYFESAGAKVPFIASDMYPYKGIIKNNVNGFLCKSVSDWYKSMKKILVSDASRLKIIQNAYKDIFNNYQLKDNLSYYLSLFNSI